jgi:hypothetical protein
MRQVTYNDAFIDGALGGLDGVGDSVLDLLHLDLRGAPDSDHSDSARQFVDSLGQLLLVVFRS